jgi:hypothetical protein
VYSWVANDVGTLTLNRNKQIKQIVIEDSENNMPIKIDLIDVREPYKLLGVQNCPVDPQLGQQTMLREK